MPTLAWACPLHLAAGAADRANISLPLPTQQQHLQPSPRTHQPDSSTAIAASREAARYLWRFSLTPEHRHTERGEASSFPLASSCRHCWQAEHNANKAVHMQNVIDWNKHWR
jgi:hypothetical protein